MPMTCLTLMIIVMIEINTASSPTTGLITVVTTCKKINNRPENCGLAI